MIVRSTDNGSSWSNSNSGVSDHYLKGVTFGNSTFQGVGQTISDSCTSLNKVEIIESTDNGSTWDGQNSPTNYCKDLYGITFGNNTFVAVGYTGKIIRSTDNGSSWDNVTIVDDDNLYGVSFGDNTFVAVGEDGRRIRSTDNGTTWDNSTSGGDTLFGVTFGNNRFMAVGESGRIVISTDNGSSWSSSTSRTSNHLNGVTFGD